ncbi:MAG TPA: hypothetical protein VMN39_09980 [Longimicrobiaceae bacterium]|nr:hypothetical protein [Longimicrobiaceae bacterium]
MKPAEGWVFTFVVRLWREPTSSAGEDWEWRGEVREVTSAQAVYFRRLRGLVRAVTQLISRADEPPRPRG